MRWKTQKWVWVSILVIWLVLAGGFLCKSCLHVTVRDEVRPQPPSVELDLTDDRIEDKNPAFDEDLVDSRPTDYWEMNLSDAVIKLDCPEIRPDRGAELLVLRPSYRDAIKAAADEGHTLLPSANLIDGAAKQFDDGLYACVDLACYRGELGFGPSAPELVKGVFEALPQGCPARPFLAAALELAGEKVELTSAEGREKKEWLKIFEGDEERSKPIGFYTWTPELKEVWRFYRFLQHEFDDENAQVFAIPRSAAQALESDAVLLEQYRAFNAFYGRLTNPLISLPIDVLIGDGASLEGLAKKHGARREAVSFFPPSTSREVELFDELFRWSPLPSNVNLMGELIRRVRSGEVDLKPGGEDGWYQHQVHALETMLLPSKGQETDKLLLMATYKKRLVEAFEAIITKRRETHVRQLSPAQSPASAMPEVMPELRVEPCATFYLRTARAYAFLQDFLVSALGEAKLMELHGLREGGTREPSLLEELDATRERFYGLYLVVCEDIGMRPAFFEGEPIDQEAAKEAALDWLEHLEDDPDLACDTRVAIPIFRERQRIVTRLWATLGVRLARLDASYARPPKMRLVDGDEPWETAQPWQLGDSDYVIPVDEFGEFELPGMTSLTRAELRAVCDEHATKDEILEALGRR